jgi:hypothetical protein
MHYRNAMEIREAMSVCKRSRSLSAFLVGGALPWMAACSVGPNYKRPAVSVPVSCRGLTPAEASNSTSHSAEDGSNLRERKSRQFSV